MFSFSFSNLRFDLFSPALFGFQESGLGLSLFLDLFWFTRIRSEVKRVLNLYLVFLFQTYVLIFLSLALFGFHESGLGLICTVFSFLLIGF